jgi:alcohol dehydrogenase
MIEQCDLSAAGNFFSPSRVIIGPDAALQIGEAARNLGATEVLIISNGLIEGLGALAGLQKSLMSCGLGVSVYRADDKEPTDEMVRKCAAHVDDRGYDLLVAVGGGSIIDLTKMVSIMAVNEGDILDYEGIDRVPRKGFPKIFVPTTAGAGAEMTRMAGVIEESTNSKKDVSSTYNLADCVILDPSMTVSLPAKLTAEIGMDGLAHAIEAYVAIDASPFSELMALEAIRLIDKNLPVAYARGSNTEARAGMHLASAFSGLALGAGKLGAVHGTGFALEAVSGLPHARCVSIMLPHIMEANMSACPNKFANIAEAMGEDVQGMPISDAAASSVKAVKNLLGLLDISIRLSDYGLSRERLSDLVIAALKLAWWFEPNPRKLSEKDLQTIFLQAFE